MPPDFQTQMREATRLTRSGDLQGATALIRQALRAGSEPGKHVAGAGEVIDVEAHVVDDAAPIAAQRLASPPAVASAAAALEPRAESFRDGRYGAAGAAGRDYKLYIPPGVFDGPRPLLVMLHGCTQDAGDFAAGTRMNSLAREHGCYVLYPVQSQRANPQRCWNWFKSTHQQRGRGEAGLLAGMTREVLSRHPIDPRRVYVAGLSAGGAMAAVLGQTDPDLFAAVGVHSGLAAGAAGNVPSALEAMKQGASRGSAAQLPVIVFHGTSDNTVHPRNGERVFGGGGAQEEVETLPAAGGRTVTRRIRRDAQGRLTGEHWLVHGATHAWAGGSPAGSYTDPRGPDASREMLRFFLAVSDERNRQ